MFRILFTQRKKISAIKRYLNRDLKKKIRYLNNKEGHYIKVQLDGKRNICINNCELNKQNIQISKTKLSLLKKWSIFSRFLAMNNGIFMSMIKRYSFKLIKFIIKTN